MSIKGVTLMFGCALLLLLLPPPPELIPIAQILHKGAGALAPVYIPPYYEAAAAGASAPPFFLSATRPIWSMPDSRMVLMVSTTFP